MKILKDLEVANLGIALIDPQKEKVIYENNYLKKYNKENRDHIISHIIKHFATKKNDTFQEVKLKSGSIIGYSVYPATGNNQLILLNEISYKKLFIENKNQNDYFTQLSSLTAEIAHEVGNPLSSVTMTLQVLLKDFNNWDNDLKKDYIGISIKELNRLSKFLKRVREISLENKLDLKHQPLKPLIEQVINNNKVLFDKKNIEIENKVPNSLKVLIDESSFYQVLFNLFHNSTSILPRAGKISIDVDENNPVSSHFIKLIYRNNGPVLKDEEKKKMFLPFFTNREKGSGIGMSLALKLMTRMGGTINLTSPPEGWGAQFTIYIPVLNNKNRIEKNLKIYSS